METKRIQSKTFVTNLVENNIASAEELEEIQAQVKEAVEASVKFAEESHSHRLNQHLKIFTQTKEKEIKWKQKQCPSVTPLSLLCLRKMRRDENVFLMGRRCRCLRRRLRYFCRNA